MLRDRHIKPSENNLVAFLVDKTERKWYDCVDVEWEIRNVAADLYVVSA